MNKWGPGTTIQVVQNTNVPSGKMYLLNPGNIVTTTTGTFTMLKPTRKKAGSWGATEAEQG